MKRTISLIMALVLCLLMCACGGGNDTLDTTETPTETTAPTETEMTKAEMLASALQVQIHEINNASVENLAKAKMDYCDKVLEIKGQISKIAEDYVVIGNADYVVNVYLPLEELATLQAFQQVTIVGQTTDAIIKSGFGGHYQMRIAYLVTDRYEFEGVIQTAGIKIYGPDGTLLDGIRHLKWDESVTNKPEFGERVTISAKCAEESNGWVYYDAILVE